MLVYFCHPCVCVEINAQNLISMLVISIQAYLIFLKNHSREMCVWRSIAKRIIKKNLFKYMIQYKMICTAKFITLPHAWR
jgi:hypothetical protein